MKTIFRLALMAACLLLSACELVKDFGVDGNGVVVEKTFDIFDAGLLQLDVPAKVTYTVAEEPSMTVRLDENLMEYLTVSHHRRQDNMLTIGSKRPLRRFKEFSIAISTSHLFFLECKGAVKFETQGPVGGEYMVFLRVRNTASVDMDSLDAGGLHVNVWGAGNVKLHSVSTESVYLEVVGRGEVSLSGEAEQVQVGVFGGEVDLTHLDYALLDKFILGNGSLKTGDRPIHEGGQAQTSKTDSLDVN